MAYGSKSLNIFFIVIIALLVFGLGAFLFMRYAVPSIVTHALNDPDNTMFDAEDRQAIQGVVEEIGEGLESYGLSREEAVVELRRLESKDISRALEEFSQNPADNAGDALSSFLQSLEIEGVDFQALARDVNEKVDPQEYRDFLQSEDFQRLKDIPMVFFSTIRDSLVALLEFEQ